MINLGSITINSGINTTFTVPSDGMQGIIIGNLSGLTCTISMVGEGISKTLYPSAVDFFPIKKGFTGVISIVPASTLSNVPSFAANTLIFDAVGINEAINQNAYPSILPTQSINPTASGHPIFSCTVGFGSTATVQQNLGVFNPSTTGKIYHFHSGRVYTSDTTGPTANLFSYLNKNPSSDSFSSSQSAISHTIVNSNRPVSAAICTSADSTAPNGGNDTPEVMNMAASTVQDFFNFPDEGLVYPGNGIAIILVSGVSGKVVRMTLKWSEIAL